MSSTEKKELTRKKKLMLVGAAALIVIVVFIVLALGYIKKFGDALVEENSGYLAEITEHIAVNVDSNISNMQKAMETVGITISGAKQDDESKIYLNRLREKYDFEYVGIALPDGMMHSTMESEEKDVSAEAFFQRSMQGESVVEYVPVKIFKDKGVSGLLISAPIYNLRVDPDHPVGVLCAMLDMKKFEESVYIDSFSGQGSTFIVDGSGEIMLQTRSLPYSNLFTTLSNYTFVDGYSLNGILGDLKAQQSGFAIYSNFGVEKYMHYRSLGIADWSVVSVVEKDIVTAKTTRLTRQLLVLGIGVIILFPLLFIFAVSSIIVSKANLQTSQTKSAFLANMSHEIRTPMNAIVGIGEILLREDLSSPQKKHVMGIVNAGNSLLTIINDILDISKMESGKFNIVEDEYELESLIYDIVAVISVRLNDKPIKFLVDVDPDLPKYLTGDMVRIKQVLTNIIGNSTKFTNSGYIRLGIRGEVKDGEITLTMPVEDTGIGIRKEDLDKLFESFSQLDTHKNRSVEGTGLGLAISKQLCVLMGGNITVESVYGQGSTFTIRVKQRVTRPEKVIQIPMVDHMHLLLLEPSEIMRAHYEVCMGRLHLSYDTCDDFNTFINEAQTGSYTHAVANRESLARLAEESPDLPVLTPIALVALKEQTNLQEYGHTIIGPLFTLQLAAVLSNDPVQSVRLQRGGIDMLSIQPMPFVRVLIVDDNEVNLQVASGLMRPYYMNIDCALSGKLALMMMESGSYDLVFMDHMMPEMDGVEALKLIRALKSPQKDIPVIALTANVTRGAQDLFLQSGFNDFLSKPIDTVRLNMILKKWLGNLNEAREKENPQKAKEFYENLVQDGHGGNLKSSSKELESALYVDFKAGIEKLGDREVYSSILATYSRSAREKQKSLPRLLDIDIETFTIEAHGLKGASGGICAMVVAEAAANLEHMAKENKVQEIKQILPAFLVVLQDTLKEIDHFIGIEDGSDEETVPALEQYKEGNFSEEDLLAFKDAFWNFDSDSIKELLTAHDVFCYEEREEKLLSELKKCYESYNFDAPIQLIDDYNKCVREEV